MKAIEDRGSWGEEGGGVFEVCVLSDECGFLKEEKAGRREGESGMEIP